MLRKLTKVGAYLLLACGIVISIAVIAFALYFWLVYSEPDPTIKVVVPLVFIVVAIAGLVITISMFETITETIVLENIAEKNAKNKPEANNTMTNQRSGQEKQNDV